MRLCICIVYSMMNEEKHIGQIVERAIRKKELNLSQLALKLNISRRNLYVWFESKHLKADVIFRIGQAIDHDFCVELPELATYRESQYQRTFKRPDSDNSYKDKYIELLDKYRMVLEQQLFMMNERQVASTPKFANTRY